MNNQIASSKYAGIAKAKQTVFLAVAAASVVAAFAGVSIYFIAQNIIFNAKVLGEQGKSLKIIETSKHNITNEEKGIEKKAKELQAKMDSDAGMRKLRAQFGGSSLRLIVDALPAEPNAPAVGASLERHIFAGLSVKNEGVSVEPVTASSELEVSRKPLTEAEKRKLERDPNREDKLSRNVKPINFSFTVSVEKKEEEGKPQNVEGAKEELDLNVFTEILQRMERSIRVFRVNSYKVEYSKKGASLSVSGQTFYLPSYQLRLENKEVKSDDKAVKKPTTGAVK